MSFYHTGESLNARRKATTSVTSKSLAVAICYPGCVEASGRAVEFVPGKKSPPDLESI